MLRLSNREMEIAGHLALGETEKEVAGKLYLSTETVHTHKKSIYRKTGARSVADVTRLIAEYVTRINISELIRKEVIEPNIGKVCMMLLFISLQFVVMVNGMDERRAPKLRMQTASGRMIRTRKLNGS